MIERSPAERLAGFNDLVEALSFAFALNDGFFGAEVVTHRFNEWETAPADFGREPLADDPSQRVCQTVTHLFLLLGFKHAKNTINGLAGVDRVQCTEY